MKALHYKALCALSVLLVGLGGIFWTPRANAAEALHLLPDSVQIHPRNSTVINVLANDRSDSGELRPESLKIAQLPKAGTVQVEEGGRILYVHTGDAVGQDSFFYSVADSRGNTGTAEVRVAFSDSLRLRNLAFNMPGDAPSNAAFQMVEAFPGLVFQEPVWMASPSGEKRRMFVLERKGVIRLVEDVTAKAPAAAEFLNLAALLANRGESLACQSSEQGLLGLAFHPKYAENRQFFLFYSVHDSDGRTFERVSRFCASPSAPGKADPSSEVVLIEQVDRAGNHQGGCLLFGPDGYLYVSVGDEGGQKDQYENAQYIHKNFFSGILRLDVDCTSGNLEPNPHPAVVMREGKASYRIPVDNPYVHTSLGGEWDGKFNGSAAEDLSKIRTEFWATGLRNPWRMSFDSETGELWAGDVGGDRFEEVNLIVKGGNYGWPYREGAGNGVKVPSPAQHGFQSTEPVAAYEHGTRQEQGNSITGGVVVRDAGVPALEGAYLYADFISGNVWALRKQKGEVAKVERLFGKAGISAFGQDPATGQVLAADYTGSRLLRLVAASRGSGFPQKLSDTGLFLKTADLLPNRGLLPYEINHPAWHDGAVSKHWFAYYATEDGQKIKVGWTADGTWSTPLGMLWVQQLDLEMEKGRPETRRRLETRVLVRNNAGAYGVTYRWNDEQTDAVLVSENGDSATFATREEDGLVQRTWRYPGQAECMVCHNSTSGYALSFSTRQMNRETVVPGFSGNQIDLFFKADFFRVSAKPSNQPPPLFPKAASMPKFAALEDPSAPLEDRVRSYLAVNCATCHQPGGLSPTAWNLRPEIPLEQTGILNGAVFNHGGNPERKVVVPGNPAHSLIMSRMQAADGFSRMPPLGTSRTDEAGVSVLRQWLGQR